MHRTRILERIIGTAAILAALLSEGDPVRSAPESGPPARSEESTREILLTAAERAEILKDRIILRDIPNPGRPGKTFEALGILPCGLDEAFAVITDFRNYAEFMPHIKQAAVKEEGDTFCVVEIRLGLPLGKSRQYRLKYQSLRTDEDFVVFWQKVHWPELSPGRTVKDTSGRWLVRKFEAKGLLASYLVYTDPRPVPLGLTGLAGAFGKKGMRDVIEKTRGRIGALFLPEGNRRRAQNSCP